MNTFDTLDDQNLDRVKTNIGQLTDSFTSLKETTVQVFKEIDDTVVYLHDQLHNTIFRFFGVIDAIPDLVLVKSNEGKWKTLNKTGQQLFGFQAVSDFYDLTDQELIVNYPYLSSGLQQGILTDEAAWKSGTHYRALEFYDVNGKELVLDVIKTPVYCKDGIPKEILIIGRDITDIYNQHNEVKTNTTPNTSNIVITDDKGQVILNNTRLLEPNNMFNCKKPNHTKLKEVWNNLLSGSFKNITTTLSSKVRNSKIVNFYKTKKLNLLLGMMNGIHDEKIAINDFRYNNDRYSGRVYIIYQTTSSTP